MIAMNLDAMDCATPGVAGEITDTGADAEPDQRARR
jgi:hypothetical protein